MLSRLHFSDVYSVLATCRHWRKNKSLRFILRTKPQVDVETNTRVLLLAGNDSNPCATLKNNIGWFRDGQAEFNDLRFLGASGRGLFDAECFSFTARRPTVAPRQEIHVDHHRSNDASTAVHVSTSDQNHGRRSTKETRIEYVVVVVALPAC